MEEIPNIATVSSTAKNRLSLPSAHVNNNGGMIHSFDCAICYESLTKPGPPLGQFTFGKLLINLSQLPYLEREHIYREFQLVDQCFSNGKFDCDKIVSTVCGHLFHAGCIREWFSMKRLDASPKCPFCNRITCYEECRILHPIACDSKEDESFEQEAPEMPAIFNETEYSDISCTSSSWPTDDESDGSNDGDDPEEEDRQTENVDENTTYEFMNEEDFSEESGYDQDESSTDNSDYMPQAYDDTIYYPVFIDNARNSNYGKIDGMIHVAREFGLAHFLTTLDLFVAACKQYHWKKNTFLAELEASVDSMEDEQLAEIDYDALVPLGYEFIGLLLIVGVFIFAEEAYFGIYQREKETVRRISAPMMILHLLTFIAFASLCLLISQAILFS